MTEAPIVTRIIRYLRSLPGGWARKTHGNAFVRGEPDVTACVRGRRVELEVKIPGKDATPVQKVALKRWHEAGAVTGVVHSLEETQDILQENDLI